MPPRYPSKVTYRAVINFLFALLSVASAKRKTPPSVQPPWRGKVSQRLSRDHSRSPHRVTPVHSVAVPRGDRASPPMSVSSR